MQGRIVPEEASPFVLTSKRAEIADPSPVVSRLTTAPADSVDESWVAARARLIEHRRKRRRARMTSIGAVALLLTLPMAGFLILRAIPALNGMFSGPVPHFWIVGGTSALALIVALAVLTAALPCRDPRVAYLGIGLMLIAGIFAVHGITTPGVIFELNMTVGVSAHLSLLAGSLFFAFSGWSGGGLMDRFVRAHMKPTLALAVMAIAGFMAASLSNPDWLGFLALTKPPIVYGSMGVTVALYLFAALRFLGSYRVAPIGFTAAVAGSAVMMAQADIMLVFSETWNGIWWGYHVTMLSGFAAATLAAWNQYRRRGGLGWAIQGMYRLRSIVQHELDSDGVVAMLSVAIEQKDGYTAGYTLRVAEIAVRIGQMLGLEPERLRLLARAGVLHDVGKIWIPDEILNKPGALSDAEFDVIKQHPLLGHEVLRRAGSLDQEIAIIATHHERMDGAGYPYGLDADEILLEARIIAAADVYDSLATDRPQRPAFGRAEVHRIMQAAAGPQLDPGLVELWLSIAQDYDGLVAAVDTRNSARGATRLPTPQAHAA